jgi:hypothetical protein
MNNVYSNTCHNVRDFSKTCKDDNPCPAGTECCQEIHENGSTGPITCCAMGSCNSKLGHCSNPRTGQMCPNSKRENYGNEKGNERGNKKGDEKGTAPKSCYKWQYISYILFSIVIMLIILVLRDTRRK